VQVSEFPLWAARIADALAAKGAAAAANAMAAEFHAQLVDVTLALTTHTAGQKTLSTPGTPPALVTGTLRRSAVIVPATAAGTHAVASCRVGAVYARIQELGGTVTVKRAKVLYNKRTKQAFGKSVRLPARPYMKPTRDLLLAERRLQQRAAQAIAAVVRDAAGG
jgi:phage gpG-like protein